MSGTAAPQNPVLPEDPFVIIGTRLSLDPTARDAAVPSVGLGVAGGVVQLDADGQIPLQCLRNLIAYLGGTYTPPTGGGTGTGTGTTPTTPTTPVTPAPATIADAVALADGAYIADGDGAVLLFPTGEPATGTGTGTGTTATEGAVVLPGDDDLVLPGGDTLVLAGTAPSPATTGEPIALADGATLADGDGVVLLFPIGAV